MNDFRDQYREREKKVKKAFPKDLSAIANFFQLSVVITIIVAFGLLSSFYQIGPEERGVVTRFGAFSHYSDPGPHFKLPFGIDQVIKVAVTRINELQFGFRKNGRLTKEQERRESLMLTGDLNVAHVEWIIQYKIEDPKKYLFHAVNVEKNIQDVSISVMRRVVGDKLVSSVLTTDRVEIAKNAQLYTQQVLDTYDMGILIIKINLQNVTPPEPVKPAFNEINMAKQEKEQMINQAKGIYNKLIPEAEGKAKKIISEAEAYAIHLINSAKGDSQKFKDVLAAYKQAPAITKKRQYLETMEEIFSDVKDVTIVDAGIKGILPIFSNNHNNPLNGIIPEQSKNPSK